MAIIIENMFFSYLQSIKQEQEQEVHYNSSSVQKLINSILQANRQKNSRAIRKGKVITVSVYHFAISPFQALAQITVNLDSSIMSLKIKMVKQDQILRVDGRKRFDSFCRMFQKCNTYFSEQENIQFAINPNNGEIIIRCYLNYYLSKPTRWEGQIKNVTEISKRIVRLISEQMNFLFESIHKKDGRYLERAAAEFNETLKIRDLISLSSINFEDGNDNMQLKCTRNKQLINFLNHRENMVNHKLKNSFFIGNQICLFTLFMEGDFFKSHPLTLDKLQQGFAKEFESLFYNFQAKKMEQGDNPFLFNTVLIKNEEEVEPTSINVSGGFSRIQVANIELAYTESQNAVFQSPSDKSRNKNKSQPKIVEYQNQKLTYISKQVAIKISHSDQDYEKIKHQKLIVRNFRGSCSPFILKYYNCTQRKFNYRQYLLMDYVGNSLTLSEFSQIHSLTFSMQSKMHVFIHISNALNFLEKRRIVHMDLSGKNIMVCKDFIVKVIDFGQAYHPHIDSDRTAKYSPGHTLPYCPPETFNTVKKFTHSSDAFSFGIILYRIIFGDFPFCPTPQLKKAFMNRTYLDRFLIAPQRLCQYGHYNQLLLLLQVICRCLQTFEKNRPIPYWLYIILNKIFLTFK